MENPKSETHGLIQWKGTDVCIDIHCKCGNINHFDGYFFYKYKCPKCNVIYKTDPKINFIEINR